MLLAECSVLCTVRLWSVETVEQLLMKLTADEDIG